MGPGTQSLIERSGVEIKKDLKINDLVPHLESIGFHRLTFEQWMINNEAALTYKGLNFINPRVESAYYFYVCDGMYQGAIEITDKVNSKSEIDRLEVLSINQANGGNGIVIARVV